MSIAELAPDLYVMHDGDASEPLATESATSAPCRCGASATRRARRRRLGSPPPPPPPPPPCVDGIIDESTAAATCEDKGRVAVPDSAACNRRHRRWLPLLLHRRRSHAFRLLDVPGYAPTRRLLEFIRQRTKLTTTNYVCTWPSRRAAACSRSPTNTAASPPQARRRTRRRPRARRRRTAAEPAAPAASPPSPPSTQPPSTPPDCAVILRQAKLARDPLGTMPWGSQPRFCYEIEAHYDCLRWYAKKPTTTPNNAGKNTVCRYKLNDPDAAFCEVDPNLNDIYCEPPSHAAAPRRRRRRRPSRPPALPAAALAAVDLRRRRRRGHWPPPPSPPCPSPPPRRRRRAAAVAESAAVAPRPPAAAVASAALAAALAAAPSPPRRRRRRLRPVARPPIIELEYNGTGSIDEPIMHLDNTIIKFQGGCVQRCDVVVWVRMDHYEHTDEDQVCKSANYSKSPPSSIRAPPT